MILKRLFSLIVLTGLLLSPLATTAAVKTAFLFKPYKALAQEEDEERDARDCVPPDELRGEVQQTREQLKEIKRLLKNKGLASADKAALTGLSTTVTDWQKKLAAAQKKPCDGTRDLVEEYREENYWEQINPIRRRVELPRELKTIDRDLKDLEKLVANKKFQAFYPELGGNLETLKTKIVERKGIVTSVNAALSQGSEAGENLDELMEPFHEGGHPGEILGVIHGMTELAKAWTRIKDTEIREAFKTALEPIVTAINEGEWRDARETAEPLQPVMERIMRKLENALKSKRGRSDLLKSLNDLEQKIEEKLGKEAPEQKGEGENEDEE